MTDDTYGPVEVTTTFRERSSTAGSTGLDYSNTYRVDEDIKSRIRSLLVSKNERHPPRTPNTSDESHPRTAALPDIPGDFDFSTAKSVASLARQTSGRLSVPEINRGQSKLDLPIMESRRQKRSSLNSAFLRTSSSYNDLRAPESPAASTESKKKSWFPKLVLKDKKKPEDQIVTSCVEVVTRIPDNDLELHETEIQCCPPCDPQDPRPSKYIYKETKLFGGPSLELDAADLACFMAGCPPGLPSCEKHRRRQSRSASAVNRDETQTRKLQEDLVRRGFSMKVTETQSPAIVAPEEVHKTQDAPQPADGNESPYTSNSPRNLAGNEESIHVRPKPSVAGSQRSRRPSKAITRKALRPSTERGLSPTSSVTSGSTMDAFPHAAQSMQEATREGLPPSFSTTVATNFSLPGYKSKQASQLLRSTLAEAGGSMVKDLPDKRIPEQVKFFGDADAAHRDFPVSKIGRVAEDDNQLLKESTFSSKSRPMPPQEVGEPKESDKLASVDRVDTQPKDMLRMKASDTSLRSKPYSASMRSGASRSSVIRYALLKPSISEAQPVDTGLPIPPMLSTISILSTMVMPNEPVPDEVSEAAGVGPQSVTLRDDEDRSRIVEIETVVTEKQTTPDAITTISRNTVVAKSRSASKANVPDLSAFGGREEEDKTSRMLDRPDFAESAKAVATRFPVAGHLTNLQKAKDLVDSVKDRIQEAEKQMMQAMTVETYSADEHDKSPPADAVETASEEEKLIMRASPEPTTSKAPALQGAQSSVKEELLVEEEEPGPNQKSNVVPDDAYTSATIARIGRAEHDFPVEEKSVPEPSQTSALLESKSSTDPSSAAYWGFVPTVKEAVQHAVQIAVRNVVHEIVVPPGMDTSTAEYRQVMSDSLSRAAKNADEQIQHARAQQDVPLGQAASESGRISEKSKEGGNPAKVSRQTSASRAPEVVNLPKAGSNPASISSRDQENDPHQKLPHSPRPLSPGKLETIDLNDDVNTRRDSDNQAWNFSKANPWKKGSNAGYTAIPSRQSSKAQVLSPKRKSTNPTAKDSRHGSLQPASQTEFLERLIPQADRRHRSVSSSGSLKSHKSEEARDVTAHPVRESVRRRNSSSDCPVDSGRTFSRKNTVHWLQDLLSTKYEPRFTALPQRTRIRSSAPTKPVRSLTAPVNTVDEVLSEMMTKPLDTEINITRPKAAKTARERRTDISETFTRTIKDLEGLMNEALIIARQAADSQDTSLLQSNLEKSINVLQDSQKSQPGEHIDPMEGKSRYATGQSVTLRSPTFCSDSEDSLLSVHESLRSFSGSSDSGLSDNDDNYRASTPKRSVTVSTEKVPPRHSAGWPPTGRVSTPYPPASVPHSRESVEVEGHMAHGREDSHDHIIVADPRSMTAEMPIKQEREDSLDQIIAADPRSMPAETHMNMPRSRTISTPLNANDQRIPGTVTASRRMTVASLPVAGEGEYMDRHEQIPEFRTVDTFHAGRSSQARKSSAKSPMRLTSARNSRATTLAAAPGLDLDTLAPAKNKPTVDRNIEPLPLLTPHRGSSYAPVCAKKHSEEDHRIIREKLASKDVPGKRDVRDYILENHQPPIAPRASSLILRKQIENGRASNSAVVGRGSRNGDDHDIDNTRVEARSRVNSREPPLLADLVHPRVHSHSLDGSQVTHSEVIDFEAGHGVRHRGGAGEPSSRAAHDAIELRDIPDPSLPPTSKKERESRRNHFSLGGKRHVSLKEHHAKGFSLTRTHKRQTIARDWSIGRKRFVATVACISTALVGILVGIYAGETPAIQYYIVDFHHYTVLGNVFFFIGLAIPTFFFWPLPLLHGRKPYILGAMSLAMPLLFPQALAVGEFRSPYVATWRVGLIFSRSLMGFCLGFANMNFKSMLTDLFGASLQSSNPHQEHVDEFDVRRHGGGMGMWLGLWTWSALGSIGLGFMIGAVIINTLSPAWGFYVSIVIIAFIMLLNVLCPEPRRSAYRRSVAEITNDEGVSRRLARGEVKMHMVQTGPKWWGEEFHYGVMLTTKMLRQPGFLIMALYTAWIYGQQVLIIVLLGALMSKDYRFKSPMVGASVLAIPLGALVAIPFQKASIFSRARQIAPVSDDATIKKKISWTSHMVRRSIFVLVLPFAGLAYTLSSSGPPIPFIVPILFAGLIGFLSNLAMAECHGIIMETFDTSDLQPGMTGRAKGSAGDKQAGKRTNYSSFPRVACGFAITQGFGYLVAAGASGVGGVLTRHLGQQAATGVMAGILLILSVLLLGTLIRFTDVQIIPDSKVDEMEQYHNARRMSAVRREEGIQEEEPWRPIILGNPHHTTRRMCLLELGSLSRFSEIRRKNRLIDERSLEAKHPNQAAIQDLGKKIYDNHVEAVDTVRRSLSRHSSRGSRMSRSDVPEQGDLGGHREMLKRGGSGNGGARPGMSTGGSGRGSGRKGTSLARKGIEE